MSHSWVQRRTWTNTRGETVTRYEVRYRLGGRGKTHYAGRFATKAEALARRKYVDGEMAALRVPDLRVLVDAPPRLTLAEWGDRWAASRVDVAPATRDNYRKHLARLGDLAGRDAVSVTVADLQRWIGELSDLKPSSVKRYLTTVGQVLDYAGVDPNPARDRRLKRPRIERTEVEPPSAAEVEAILDNIAPRWRLPIRLLESTAMRVGELCALDWGDVDIVGQRFRVRSGKTRAARRWVQVPAGQLADLLALVPPDDRAGAVFAGVTGQDLRQAMGRACRAAGIPRYSPHDLRHRRASVWHAEGVPFVEIAARVGHSRTTVTVDTYTHVLLSEGD